VTTLNDHSAEAAGYVQNLWLIGFLARYDVRTDSDSGTDYTSKFQRTL